MVIFKTEIQWTDILNWQELCEESGICSENNTIPSNIPAKLEHSLIIRFQFENMPELWFPHFIILIENKDSRENKYFTDTETITLVTGGAEMETRLVTDVGTRQLTKAWLLFAEL